MAEVAAPSVKTPVRPTGIDVIPTTLPVGATDSKLPLVVGAVAGLAALGASKADTLEMLLHPIDKRISFQPGDHWSEGPERDRKLAAFHSGDLSIHSWNQELVERLHSLGPELQVLTLDAASPIIQGEDQIEEKRNMWLWTPLRGRSLYIVAGDTSLPEMAFSSFQTESQLKQERDGTTFIGMMKKRWDEAWAESRKEGFPNSQEKNIMKALIVTAILAQLSRASRAERKTIQKWGSLRASRRSLLRAALLGSAAVTLGLAAEDVAKRGNITEHYAATSSSEGMKELWQNLDSLISDIPPHIMGDGRTALLIEKNAEAMDRLRGDTETSEGNEKRKRYIDASAKGATVLGKDHMNNAVSFIRDDTARHQAIWKYAQHILAISNQFIDKHFAFSPEQRAAINESLLTSLARTQILRVTDPGFTPGQDVETEMNAYIDQNVQPIDTYTSERVMTIVKPLLTK